MQPDNLSLRGARVEAYRVLRPGGRLHIWDANIPEKSDDKKHFVIPIKIVMPNETVETGYGSHLKKQRALEDAMEVRMRMFKADSRAWKLWKWRECSRALNS